MMRQDPSSVVAGKVTAAAAAAALACALSALRHAAPADGSYRLVPDSSERDDFVGSMRLGLEWGPGDREPLPPPVRPAR